MAAVTAIGLWSETRAVVGRHRNAVLTLAATFVFLPGAALRLLAAPTATAAAAGVAHDGQVQAITVSPLLVLLLVAAMALQIGGVFAIAAITADRAEGGGRPLRDTLAAAVPGFGRFLAALPLFALGYLPVAMVLAVILAASGVSPDALARARSGQPSLGLAASVVGVVLPLLIWLWARLLPLVGVYLRETAGILDGIRRAWTLTRGSALPLVALLLAWLIGTLAIRAAQNALPGTGFAGVAVDLIAAAASAWVFAYAAAATGVVYRELAR